MHPDVLKLVEAGRLPKPVGERVSQISPGQFCLHKTWGAGKVLSWDLPKKRVSIQFEKNQEPQDMDLGFALKVTTWVAPDDFRAKKVEVLDSLTELAESDPVALIKHVLESHGGVMTGDALEVALSGSVIPESKYRKWYDNAKVKMRESRAIVVPAKKTENLVLRCSERTPAQALAEDFLSARDLKGMIKAIEAITADIGAFDDERALLQEVLQNIDDSADKSKKVQFGLSLQLLAARDEVLREAKIEKNVTLPISELLKVESTERIADEVGALPSNRQRAIFEAFPAAFGEAWVDRITSVFDCIGSRGVTEIARLLDLKDEIPALSKHLRTTIAKRALGPDALIWISRERRGLAKEVFSPEIGAAILNLLENDVLSDGARKTTRLQALLTDDKTLLQDLVAKMDDNETRNFSRRLLDCPAFGDLEKKSLLARIIRVNTKISDLVSGESSRVQELLVSWESLERKKAELDNIISVLIPQNTKDISIAREYGDLRENFEYKSAKDQQKYLNNRKAELQRDLGRARGTDFKNVDISAVNIGTIVTLEKTSSKDTVVYTVLGAWDSDPEKRWLSYLSELGAAMLTKKVKETLEFRDPDTDRNETFTIVSIQPYNA